MTTTAAPAPSMAEDTREKPAKPQERPVRRPMSFGARLASQALLMFSVGLLGFGVFLLVLSPVQQNNDQDRLYATLREQLAEETAPTGGSIPVDSPVAILQVPGLKLDQVVVEGTASGDLRTGPGHRRDTPLPGQAGQSLIYGKSSTFGAPFRQIDLLRSADRITVTTGQGAFTYRVRDVRRDGDPVPSRASGTGRLTLVTSEGSNILQREHTVFVDADLVDRPAVTPAGRPTLIPPQEQAMASDTGSNGVLVLLLQGIGVVLGCVVWARRGWDRRIALVLGTPLLLAAVWAGYETVARLLPNLL